MNKEQLEQFNEKFDVYKAPNWWLPNLDDKKMYTLITEYNKSIKQFISDILKAQRQEIIEMGDEIGDELHTHNSIPNYIDNLNEGCPICIKNQAIKDYQTKIKTITKQK